MSVAERTENGNGKLDMEGACKVAIRALAPAALAGKRTQLAAKYETEWAAELKRRRDAVEKQQKAERERKRREDEARRERKRERDRQYRARKRAEKLAQLGNLPDLIALCPKHADEFYVPHGGTCPQPGCDVRLVEYTRSAHSAPIGNIERCQERS